jgi:rhodanese-related sulfurtransferase
MGFFDFFGFDTNDGAALIDEFIQKNAVIIDVRTLEEFENGHVAGSINIPLHELANEINRIKKFNKPVIACCRTGARSGSASNMLKNSGIESINGGAWQTVDKHLHAKS